MSTSAVSSLDVLVYNILFKKEKKKQKSFGKFTWNTGHSLGNWLPLINTRAKLTFSNCSQLLIFISEQVGHI